MSCLRYCYVCRASLSFVHFTFCRDGGVWGRSVAIFSDDEKKMVERLQLSEQMNYRPSRGRNFFMERWLWWWGGRAYAYIPPSSSHERVEYIYILLGGRECSREETFADCTLLSSTSSSPSLTYDRRSSSSSSSSSSSIPSIPNLDE